MNRRPGTSYTTTLAGRVVYDRKQHLFTLRRISKIIDKLMSLDTMLHDPLQPDALEDPYPNATLFYIYTRVSDWVGRRDLLRAIYMRDLDQPLLHELQQRDSEAFLEELRKFYEEFDHLVSVITEVSSLLEKFLPELKPFFDLLLNTTELYETVRILFPI